MKSLYLRVWLTVVVVLALFALGSGWLAQRHVAQERQRLTEQGGDRIRALGELIGQALPEADAPVEEQAAALRLWSERLRMPLALDDARGVRVAVSPAFERRQTDGIGPRALPLALDDGRTLWVMRPPRPDDRERRGGPPPRPVVAPAWFDIDPLRSGTGLLVLTVLLFVAVAAGAYPVVRSLTRRLEALQRGVERFGAGALSHRVEADGRDEVARLAVAFNQAADRIEALVQSHNRLVANASHELRSPLARLKAALGLLESGGDEATRARLQVEIRRNLRELDGLIEELLMASRLQAREGASDNRATDRGEVDVLALVAEEAAACGAELLHADAVPPVRGEERLLRRAVRNLLENAARYGGGSAEVEVGFAGTGRIEVRVLDRGPGVPDAQAERIFEPFYRLPGHAESEGGVGLGLSLVRQIARDHGGTAEVRPRSGGGSCFVLSLPVVGGAGASRMP